MADLVSLSEEDLAEVMRIERLPGYDAFIGRFTLEEHRAEFISPAAHYLGFRKPGGLTGFVILQQFDQPQILLRRIAIETVERGTGTRLLREVMDWVFDTTAATQLDLNVREANPRARGVYSREGFEDVGFADDHYKMAIPRERWASLRNHA
jgi:RimJ/RimL family protein N-acetyltransferase